MKGNLYRHYLLIVLLVILAFNYVDSLALGLVLQNIKLDLHLSDTQLGVLSGIAFALFYSVMGIPIARWADRGNRVTIISLTAAIWSIMVICCGVAANFLQLLLIRVGVAIGEAGCVPPAHSLIADYFTRAERPRAVAIYMLGGSLSMLIGYFVAGWINQFYGWRATFMVLGLPGLALAGLAGFTLREPRRELRSSSAAPGAYIRSPRQGADVTTASTHSVSLPEAWAILWANATFRHLLMCFSVMSFFSTGILQWQPAFFIRSYGLTTGELGTWFAIIYGGGGFLGTFLGGELGSRLAANNERLQLKAMAVAYAALAVISAFVYLTRNHYLAFGLIGVGAVFGGMVSGPLFATVQTLVPQRLRATSIALIYLLSNLIGAGLGPLVAGALSDALQPWLAAESLRYALLALCPGYLWGAWHLWGASRTVVRDLEREHVDGERGGMNKTAGNELPDVSAA